MSVYLDYQAAKPVDVRVISEMTVYLNQKFANPSSLHCDGDEATDALREYRRKVADYINAPNPESIIFTSGATESNNLALIGGAMRNKKKGDHIIISEIEHISILNIAKNCQADLIVMAHHAREIDGIGIADLVIGLYDEPGEELFELLEENSHGLIHLDLRSGLLQMKASTLKLMKRWL